MFLVGNVHNGIAQITFIPELTDEFESTVELTFVEAGRPTAL